MITVTEEQKVRFKNVVNKKFEGKVKFINIVILNSIPDLVDTLLVNNISFNYIVDNDGLTELVPEGYATNGGYKYDKTVYCNPNVEHMNIGLVLKDELNILTTTLHLKQRLIQFCMQNKIRLAIGNNVNIILPPKNDDVIYKKVSIDYIVDTTFRFFSELFIV